MAGFSINSDLCTGCLNCEAVCSLLHSGMQDRSASVIRVNLELFSGRHTHIYCRQCEKPECSEACMADAVYLDDQSSAWKIDYDICTKCGICVKACPHGAMFLHEPEGIPFKCDLCEGVPACLEACRFNAISPIEESK